MNKALAVAAACTILAAQASACATPDYSWAETEIEYCRANGIMTGDEHGRLHPEGTITRAQMAKMITEGFSLEAADDGGFSDVSRDMWYYDYAAAIKGVMPSVSDEFNGDAAVTREELAATLVSACGIKESSLAHTNILEENFEDYEEVSPEYKKLLSIAVERAYFRGDDGKLRPRDNLSRAEVCALMYRVLESRAGRLTLTWEDLGVKYSYTPIQGEPQITQEAAVAWAKSKNASDLFIEIAPYYWKYGEIFGMRPEILYAQAARETGYGKFGRHVLEDMYNFAGIKRYGMDDSTIEAHESFATPEDGVRGHYNHMSAYVGVEPVGEVHGRYNSVIRLAWAGTVKNTEALGGKWCSDLYYGYSIVHFVDEMKNY